MRNLILALSLLLVAIGVPASTAADEPLGSPEASILFDAQMFGNQGDLNALGNAGIIGHYWEEGLCPEGEDYSSCDALRFGMAMYNQPDCQPGMTMLEEPREDGGEAVEQMLDPGHANSIDHCDTPNRRHLADALADLDTFWFGDDTDADDWFDHPLLNLTVLEGIPDGAGPDHDGQVGDSIRRACSLHGGQLDDDGRPLVPSVPTWVVTVDEEVLPFAGMLAAAGGTGACCDTWTDPDCEPGGVDDDFDVCDHVDDRAEIPLRDDIADGRYRCRTDDGDTWSTGALFVDGGHHHWRCLLDADHYNCDGDETTQTALMSEISCIRHVPPEAWGKDYGFKIWDDETGQYVTVPESDYEYIDDNETLVAVDSDSMCWGDSIVIDPCPSRGENCQVPGAQGRCAVGHWKCPTDFEPQCRRQFDPMPELCDGLDNSCDGRVNNIAETWNRWLAGDSDIDSTGSAPDPVRDCPDGGFCFRDGELPMSQLPGYPDEFHEGAACYGEDVCRCPDGTEANHVGVADDEYEAFVDHIHLWDPNAGCQCSPD